MSTELDTYRTRLVLALRLRDVPGVRIGEALAEVDSHVAETGEGPHDAFGDPVAYADRLAGSLDAAGRDDAGAGGWRGWRGWWETLRAMSRLSLAVLPVLCVAGWVFGSGLISLGAGTTATFGLTAPWAVLLGAGVLTLGALRVARHEADPVVDPRTGADMLPVSRSTWALIVAGHLAAFGALVLLGYLMRP